jgi:predicted transcriptional regulator
MKTIFSFTIDPAILAKLRKKAEKEGRTVSEMIRRAIDNSLKPKP